MQAVIVPFAFFNCRPSILIEAELTIVRRKGSASKKGRQRTELLPSVPPG
jgi:hypothetical protein